MNLRENIAAAWLATNDPTHLPAARLDHREEVAALWVHEGARRDAFDPAPFEGLSDRDREVKMAVLEIFAESAHVPHVPTLRDRSAASGPIDAREGLPHGMVDVLQHPLRKRAANSGELATSDGMAAWLLLSASRLEAQHPETARAYRANATRLVGLQDWRERLRIEIVATLSRPARLRRRPEAMSFPWMPPGLPAALRSVVGERWQRVTLGRGGGSDRAQGVPAVVEAVARRVDLSIFDDIEVACAIDEGASSAAAVERAVSVPKARIPAAIARLETAKIIANEGTPQKPAYIAA